MKNDRFAVAAAAAAVAAAAAAYQSLQMLHQLLAVATRDCSMNHSVVAAAAEAAEAADNTCKAAWAQDLCSSRCDRF